MNKKLLFDKFPYLESDELILKKVEDKDVYDLFEIKTNKNLGGNTLKSIEAVKNVIGHFERDFNKHKIIYLGIYYKKASNKLVGIAEIFDINDKINRVEVGYTLNEDYWGKGIATKATAMMLDYLFNVIDVNRIQATVLPINEKSKNVLKRTNFVHEGTLRQYKYWGRMGIADIEMFSILKLDYTK